MKKLLVRKYSQFSASDLKRELRRCGIYAAISICVLVVGVLALGTMTAYANASISLDLTTEADGTGAMGVLDILILFTVLALLPSLLLLTTSFTRIVIVMSFLRSALGTQTTPPNQVIVGLALFLTLFVMSPVINQMNTEAYQPYKRGELTQVEAVEKAVVPLKQFMIKQTDKKSMNLFLSIGGYTDVKFDESNAMDVLSKMGLEVIVPAFVTSELTRAFSMAFMIFLPFLIIDIVVSSLLMSMGMVMLPPAMISLPFKLLMFILVDGWTLLLGTLAQSFK